MKYRFALLGAAALMAATVAFGESYAYVRTCTDADASLQWKTVTSSSTPVALDWPANAWKAVVRADGVDLATVYAAASQKRTVDVSFDMPASDAREKIAHVSVTYYDENEREISSSAVKLALVYVDGLVSGQSIRVRDPESAAWGSAPCVRPLVPVPVGTTRLTVRGTVVTPDIPPRGWHGVEIVGTDNLVELTVGEVIYTANLTTSRGLLIGVR